MKEVIIKGYVNGAFNALDPEEMEKAFHEEFAIFSPGENGALNRYPIDYWISQVKKQKSSSGFDPESNKIEYNFVDVELLGTSAAVTIELLKGNKVIYTDYLSLLKFDDDWKIVAKFIINMDNY